MGDDFTFCRCVVFAAFSHIINFPLILFINMYLCCIPPFGACYMPHCLYDLLCPLLSGCELGLRVCHLLVPLHVGTDLLLLLAASFKTY